MFAPMFHVIHLQTHLKPALPLSPAPLPLDNDAAARYEVENILDSCMGHSIPGYLMIWLDYPVFESMWEPALHLANAPDILQ